MSQSIGIMLQSIVWPKIKCLQGFKSKKKIYSNYCSLRQCPKHLRRIFAQTQSIVQYKEMSKTFLTTLILNGTTSKHF